MPSDCRQHNDNNRRKLCHNDIIRIMDIINKFKETINKFKDNIADDNLSRD